MLLSCRHTRSQSFFKFQDLICSHSPSGTSSTNVLHFAQCVNHGTFARFDYGKIENLKHYRQTTPPSYDLSKVRAPVILMWGQRDWLADPVVINKQ